MGFRSSGYHIYGAAAGGGGGVVGNVAIGPQFGSSGDTHSVTLAHDLNSFALAFPDQHTTSLAHDLTTFSLAFANQYTTSLDHSINQYQRDYAIGSNAVTENAVGGRTDWANDANAQGLNNGTTATIAGNVAGARGGQLQLAYQDIPDFTTFGFTVVSAHLDFYTTLAGTLLNNGDLRHQYSVGGATTTLATFTANTTSNPATYDITSAITSQATLDALTAYVYFESALGETFNATCDAVVLRLVVTHA